MLRIYLIAIIAVLAGLVVLAMLMRLGRRHAEGSALIAWRHVVSAAVGLVVFLGLALLLEVGGTGQPGTDYQPPRIDGGKIKPGEFTKSELTNSKVNKVELAKSELTKGEVNTAPLTGRLPAGRAA